MQMFNHFPHSRCICVKDSLAKIMRCAPAGAAAGPCRAHLVQRRSSPMRAPHARAFSAAGWCRTCRQAYGAAYNFVPESFILPTEYEKLTARHLTKKVRQQ